MLDFTDYMERVALEPEAIVYFTASWCQPCKMVKPHFVKLANEDESRQYYIVDIDAIPQFWLGKYKIKSVPQIHVLRDGQSIDTIKARTYIEMKAEVETL